MRTGKIFAGAICAIFAMGMTPASGLAETVSGEGVMDSGSGSLGEGGYIRQVYNSSDGEWTFNDEGKQLFSDIDGNGSADADDYGSDGQVRLAYTTDKWKDPDGNDHPAGTYQVIIPTLISYSGMRIGKVATSDEYDVIVRGAIEQGKTVSLTAESGKSIVNGTDSFSEVTTQGKTSWSAEEVFGSLNDDGSLEGTSAKDSIAMSGVAKSPGTYTGTVLYTSKLS